MYINVTASHFVSVASVNHMARMIYVRNSHHILEFKLVKKVSGVT